MIHPQDISLSSWTLGRNSPVLRQPGRHPSLRHWDFEDKYDFRTVFYDCFWSEDGQSVFLIGPPLLNLDEDLGMRFFAMPSGEECRPEVIPRTQVTLMSLAVPPSLRCLRIESAAGTTFLAPQPNHADLFGARRVLTTLSQNNELEWIRDWVIFHQRHHGCDAVLVYDNNSTKYDISELRACLSGIAGVSAAAVSWPYLYGPFDCRFPLTYDLLHGHFCQFGMLEHARWRFLSSARSILNADIDEIILCEGGKSLFALTEDSSTGYVRFQGLWVENLRSSGLDPQAMPLHRDFWHIRNSRMEGCESKWAAVPGKVPRNAQMFVHEILGHPEAELPVMTGMRHYKALNVNWTVDTPGALRDRTRADAAIDDLGPDETLAALLDTAFRGVPRAVKLPPAADRQSAVYRARLRSAALSKAGQLHEAGKAAADAIGQAPGWPSLQLHQSRLAEIRGEAGAAAEAKEMARIAQDAAAEVHFSQGRYLLHTGEYGGAARAFSRALKRESGFVPAYHELARLHWFAGRPGAAERVLRRGLRNCPSSGVLHFALGDLCSSIGRHAEALEHADEAASLDPLESRIDTLRARTLLALGRPGEGCIAARRAIELQSDNTLLLEQFSNAVEHPFHHRYPELYSLEARSILIKCLLRMNALSEALEESATILSFYSSFPSSHLARYLVLTRQGDAERADEELHKAIKLARRDVEEPLAHTLGQFRKRERFEYRVHDLHRMLMMAGQQEEALALLKSSLKVHADIPSTAILLAARLSEAGASGELREHLAAAVRRFPRHPDLWREYGQALSEGGEKEQAIAALRTAVRLGGHQPWLRTQLAQMLIDSGLPGEAEAILRDMPEAGAENGMVHFCLSEVYRNQGMVAEAIAPCRKAAGLLSGEAWIWSHLGDLLVQAKLLDEAEEKLKHAEGLKPDDMLTQFRLGRVHEERGETAAALARMARAVEIDSSQDWLWNHYGNLLRLAGETAKADAAFRKADEVAGRKPAAAGRRSAT